MNASAPPETSRACREHASGLHFATGCATSADLEVASHARLHVGGAIADHDNRVVAPRRLEADHHLRLRRPKQGCARPRAGGHLAAIPPRAPVPCRRRAMSVRLCRGLPWRRRRRARVEARGSRRGGALMQQLLQNRRWRRRAACWRRYSPPVRAAAQQSAGPGPGHAPAAGLVVYWMPPRDQGGAPAEPSVGTRRRRGTRPHRRAGESEHDGIRSELSAETRACPRRPALATGEARARRANFARCTWMSSATRGVSFDEALPMNVLSCCCVGRIAARRSASACARHEHSSMREDAPCTGRRGRTPRETASNPTLQMQ